MPIATAIAVTPGNPESLQRIQIDIPDPGPTEVLVDVIRCGICGTDQEIIAGHIGAPPPNQTSLVLGHEVLGRVNAVGNLVTEVSPGDLVTATVRRPDECPSCQAGQVDMCQWGEYEEHGIQQLHGFMAEKFVTNRRYIIPVASHLEETGVLIEPLTVVEKAVRQARLIQRRMKVWEPRTGIVAGAGPIGILGTLLLRSLGLDVYTVARTPAPNPSASVIEHAGAHYVSSREEPISSLAKRIGNVDIILECTGASSVSFEMMEALGTNGVLVLLSVTAGDTVLPIPTDHINSGLVMGNKVIVGVVNSGIEDFVSAASRLDHFESLWPGLPKSIITHRIPYDGRLHGILHQPGNSIKTVIEFVANH